MIRIWFAVIVVLVFAAIYLVFRIVLNYQLRRERLILEEGTKKR